MSEFLDEQMARRRALDALRAAEREAQQAMNRHPSGRSRVDVKHPTNPEWTRVPLDEVFDQEMVDPAKFPEPSLKQQRTMRQHRLGEIHLSNGCPLCERGY